MVAVDEFLGEITRFTKGNGVSYKPVNDYHTRRIVRSRRREAMRQVLLGSVNPNGKSWAVCSCMRGMVASEVFVLADRKNRRSTFGNLMVCSKLWQCAECAAKICEKRKLEIEAAANKHIAAGGKLVMCTLTFSHAMYDFLGELLGRSGRRSGLIDITEDQYNAAMSRPAGTTLDVVNGQMVIVPAPLPTMDERRTAALSDINRHHDSILNQLVGAHAPIRVGMWPTKLDAARAITSNTPLSPMAQTFLTDAGLTTAAVKATWAAAVISKASAYARAVGVVEKLRDTARTAINTASDNAAIDTALVAYRTATESATTNTQTD